MILKLLQNIVRQDAIRKWNLLTKMSVIFCNITIVCVIGALFYQVPAMAQSANPTMNSQYATPVRFEVLSDRLEIKPLKFTYQFLEEGKSIQLSGVSLLEKDFTIQINEAKSKKNQAAFAIGVPSLLEQTFRTELTPVKTLLLEFISRTGKVLFSKKWESKKNPNPLVFEVNVAKIGESANYESLLKEPFLVCIANGELPYRIRLCSSYYELVRSAKRNFVIKVKPYSETPKRVILNAQVQDDTKTESGEWLVKPGDEFSFFVNLSQGWTLDLRTKVKGFRISEMLKEENKNIYLLGEGPLPVHVVKLLSKEKMGEWTEFFGWQETIGDLRVFWEYRLKPEDKQLIAVSEGGVPLVQEFKAKSIPVAKMRPYLSTRTPIGTYVDGVALEGRKHPGVQLSSKENSVELDPKDNTKFTWYFKAQDRGQLNKSYLDLSVGENSFRTYYEMFKGYPREFSLRMSGVAGSGGQLSSMGELAFNYWFEDLWSWRNYWLSRHRWGLSLKGFQSLSDLTIVTPAAKLTEHTADLKYRLTPGLWNRDETWGLMLSYQKVQFGSYEAGMSGGGFFWARSMPKIFDDIFNLMPVFRYPKWVDLEFIYYTMGINVGGSSGGTLRGPSNGGNGNWALNFHGKLMWTNNIFGEAGFGVKQIDFAQDRYSFQFTTFYGTVGLGYNF